MKLKPFRNHVADFEGDSEYDVQGEHEGFDRDHLKAMFSDYLGAEPAIRYQMARNYFERALYSTQGQDDIATLLHSNAPASMQAEARMLMKERKLMMSMVKDNEEPPPELAPSLEVNTGKLFQLFIQREDMQKFTSDFDDWEATLGPASPDDNYAWNNFILETDEDYDRLEADLRSYNYMQYDNACAKEERRVKAKQAKVLARKRNKGEYIAEDAEEEDGVQESGAVGELAGKTSSESDAEREEAEADKEFMEGAAVEKESYDKFDTDRVSDHDGHLWSGIVVHADTTQKITPGGRIMSHRCLVCIGNMKGVGGYGMGKGETANVALTNAFRCGISY